MTNNSLPIACNSTAIEADRREAHFNNGRQLFAAAQATKELADGYAFRFSNETDTILKLAEYIAVERLCCPFFSFALELEADGGPAWLKMTGPNGIKQFLQTELSLSD